MLVDVVVEDTTGTVVVLVGVTIVGVLVVGVLVVVVTTDCPVRPKQTGRTES